MDFKNTFGDCFAVGKIKAFLDSIHRSGKASAAFHVSETAKDFLISGALTCPSGDDASPIPFALVVEPDYVSAKRAQSALTSMLGEDVPAIFFREDLLLRKHSDGSSGLFDILTSLDKMLFGGARALVITCEAFITYFPDPDRLKRSALDLVKNCDYDVYEISKSLIGMGYEKVSAVLARGQFSRKGDILDIFPTNGEYPSRLEFFGDTLESIKQFSVDTMLTKRDGERDGIHVFSATDFLAGDEEVSKARSAFLEELNTAAYLSADAYNTVKDKTGELFARAETGDRDSSLTYLLPYFKSCYGSICDYLPQNSVIFFNEPKKISESVNALYEEHDRRFLALCDDGKVLKSRHGALLLRDGLFASCSGYSRALIYGGGVCGRLSSGGENAYSQTLTEADQAMREVLSISGGDETEAFVFNASKCPRYDVGFTELARDVHDWVFNGYCVAVYGRDRDTAKNAAYELSKENCYAAFADSNFKFEKSKAAILPYELSSGFIFHDVGLALIGTDDVFKPRKKRVSSRAAKDAFISFEVGDYVVHETHGIGLCKGIKLLKLAFDKEYLSVEFRGGDMLYVPCDRLDCLSKYSGGDEKPTLSKIGGKEFSATVERVRKSIRALSADLRTLYMRRAKSKGFAFAPDNDVTARFAESFEYEETADQRKAISEIKADMESDRIMDRLLSGDVGYGKTEVALRAAMKAVVSGKQVAFLSPTTILARQHYELLKKRFDGFGVNVCELDRFCSQAGIKASLSRLASGKTDIVSGTHRLLGKDVVFHDLGLLIVDEEQRFGVEDKEKIKLLKESVDVLSMSATPIPRTLHLSLTGLRDISVIETPPVDRLPVQTSVAEYSDELLRDVILRELIRDGQAFVLYNRVESIGAFASRLSALIPTARVGVAHGRLDAARIDDVMMDFYSGKTNVLVCTTIIENGIDVPQANTLVVIDSDRLGLAQLYQLRGRVGRSNRLAYVYFTYDASKTLTDEAKKRLSAILEYTELGSGFKIAMRDLEIRGAGNVLGREQHGHIAKIGYDMYVKLLRESMNEAKAYADREFSAESETGGEKMSEGNVVQRSREPDLAPRYDGKVEIDADVDCYIPESYVEDSAERIRLYRMISGIEEPKDCRDILDDLRDVYGKPPSSVRMLVSVSLMKALARRLGVVSVQVKKSGGYVEFFDNGVFSVDGVLDGVSARADECAFSLVGEHPRVVFQKKGRADASALQYFEDILKFLFESYKKSR